jgi:hypothetical protein
MMTGAVDVENTKPAHTFGYSRSTTMRNEERTPIKRWSDGDHTKFCKTCGEHVEPKERLTGEID